MLLNNNDIVLFQGDSITDAGRIYEDGNDLGRGYPLLIGSMFAAMYKDMDVRFRNRSISGNRTRDLRARWADDCIALKPTVVSILIGINDCWRRYDRNDPTPIEEFEDNYRNILERTRDELGARIILCEPFVLPTPPDRKMWREDLDPKIHVVRQLADEFDALLIPLDGIFAQAATYRRAEVWAPDGVHPTPAGHGLIAKSWLEAVKAL
ncbi:MAG: SGNH/GDSL hydrolase family protein [Clostridiales bacterium]|nr:SGNH/GDSL hydrolase family protein [Clostridiales bacterium]